MTDSRDRDSEKSAQIGEHENIPEYITHPEKEFATGGVLLGPMEWNEDTDFSAIQCLVILKSLEHSRTGPLKITFELESRGEVTPEFLQTEFLQTLNAWLKTPTGRDPNVFVMRHQKTTLDI